MCNFAVGYFKDDPRTIEKALLYVEAFDVPIRKVLT